MDSSVKGAVALGTLIGVGLTLMGYELGSSAIRFKEYERVVSVKGLSEREVAANVAVWPIQFTGADADLTGLYSKLEADTRQILSFLASKGFDQTEITIAAPMITDKLAQRWESGEKVQLRYTGQQTITVYSGKVDLVRASQNGIAELGKKGIAFGASDRQQHTEFLFTELNAVKPAMIEEATRKAREVAEKFANDSNSRLGKIRSANQGQFTVTDRDSNTPHIKKVRVVSTVEYYLSD